MPKAWLDFSFRMIGCMLDVDTIHTGLQVCIDVKPPCPSLGSMSGLGGDRITFTVFDYAHKWYVQSLVATRHVCCPTAGLQLLPGTFWYELET